MQTGNIKDFIHLSRFENLKEFNNHVEQWMLDIKDKFTKSELVALKRLIRYSAKVAGVCNAKIGTIVSATHEKDGVGISRSTFKRMINKAKDFGLISVYETVRKNGSKSSNVYSFNRFYSQAEPSKKEKLNHPQTSNLSKTNNINNNKRTHYVTNELTHEEICNKNKPFNSSYTSERVPAQFTNFVRNFYDDAKQIEEYWKLVSISAYKQGVNSGLVEIGIKGFKALIRKIKFSNVKNTYGFFYGVLNNKFKAKYKVDLFNDVWDALEVV